MWTIVIKNEFPVIIHVCFRHFEKDAAKILLFFHSRKFLLQFHVIARKCLLRFYAIARKCLLNQFIFSNTICAKRCMLSAL